MLFQKKDMSAYRFVDRHLTQITSEIEITEIERKLSLFLRTLFKRTWEDRSNCCLTEQNPIIGIPSRNQ